MPRTGRIPGYRLHKPSGRAVVTLNGRDHYLGPHGSAASKQLYARLIAEHAAGAVRTSGQPGDGFTVNELLAAFVLHAEDHYPRTGRTIGRPSTSCRFTTCRGTSASDPRRNACSVCY